jgi:hypothetical protein
MKTTTNSPEAQERTQEQILETMNRRFVGKKVLIIGDHPHVDRIGVVDRAEKTHVGWGYVVNFPQGDSCFVFSGKNWRLL